MQHDVDAETIARAAASLGVKIVRAKSRRQTFKPGTTQRADYLAKWERRLYAPGMVPVPHREQFAKDAAKDAFHV